MSRPLPIRAPLLDSALASHDDLVLSTDSVVEDSRLVGARLDVVAHDVEITGSMVVNGRFTGAAVEGIDIVDVVFEACELSGATFERCSLERVVFRGCRMSGFTAPGLHGRDVLLVDCVLDQAWLRMCTLERTRLERCDLTGTDLYGSTISDSRLERCTLDGTDWSQATLRAVGLHGSTLAEVRGSCGIPQRDDHPGSDHSARPPAVRLARGGCRRRTLMQHGPCCYHR